MSLTITSQTNIVYNKSLDLYEKGFDIVRNQYALKKSITYRRYVFGENNLSGDKSFADYNDYEIDAELQFEGKTKNVTDAGYVISDFGTIYIPGIISVERDGTPIPSFRPQIKDEFKFDNKWYVINNMTPVQFVTHAFGMECLFRLISNEETNPKE